MADELAARPLSADSRQARWHLRRSKTMTNRSGRTGQRNAELSSLSELQLKAAGVRESTAMD
jgi:hypothetical protein